MSCLLRLNFQIWFQYLVDYRAQEIKEPFTAFSRQRWTFVKHQHQGTPLSEKLVWQLKCLGLYAPEITKSKNQWLCFWAWSWSVLTWQPVRLQRAFSVSWASREIAACKCFEQLRLHLVGFQLVCSGAWEIGHARACWMRTKLMASDSAHSCLLSEEKGHNPNHL